MRLFSFSRATFGSNQKATAVSRIRDAEKIEDDWHSSPHGPHQPSDGGLYTTGDQSATQGDAAFDPFGTTSEPTLGGHGVVNPEPVVRPHIFALSSLAEDSAFVVRKVDGGIGETPVPPIRALVSRKRSSRSSFFAFSSKRRSHHGSPIIQMPQSQQTPRLKAQIADPSALPSPLRTDNEDYYYCNSPFPPSQPSSPVTPRLDTLNFFPPRRKRSVRSQSHQITLDSDSQKSSPINYHSPSHSHPFSVSANALRSTISSDLPPVQLAGLSEERIRPGGGGLGNEESGVLLFPIPPQRLPLTTRDNRAAAEGKLPQARGLLRTSFSVPNLHSAMRATPHQASMKASGPTTKSKDLLLTAGSWCDMLIFPRPRLKANQEPGTTKQFVITPPCTPIPGDGVGGIAPTLSSRPDTNSATLVAEHVPPNAQSPPVPLEARIISPALNAPPDEEVMPSADNPHGPDFEAELSLPTPHPTVSQVLKEGEDLAKLRERWKMQATKSLGNKHSRSFSRARSKSLSDKQVRPGPKSNTGKGESKIEYLTARALLGSQGVPPPPLSKKPSGLTTHSKSYSQAIHSVSTPTLFQSSHSRSHSHAHSHSLSTSHSSKSSQNVVQHTSHSRSDSWGKTVLIKAGGVLCGVCEDNSPDTPLDGDHVLPMQKPDTEVVVNHNAPSGNGADAVNGESHSPSPIPVVEAIGIAISSPFPCEEHASPGHDFSMPNHPFAKGNLPPRLADAEDCPHRHVRTLSEYAGPHPSVLDPNLPAPSAASGVSLRHRLPPRPAAYLTVPSISHPYGAGPASPTATPSIGEHGQSQTRARAQTLSARISTLADCALGPHASVTSAEFEQYGVGRALVYSVLPRQGGMPPRSK